MAAPGQSQITVSGTVFQKMVEVCEVSFAPPLFIPVVDCHTSSDISICVANFPSIDSCTTFTTNNGEWEFTIDLSPGKNNIEVHANDANGDDPALDNLFVTVPLIRSGAQTQIASRQPVFPFMTNSTVLRHDFELPDQGPTISGINFARVDESVNEHGQAAITWNQDSQIVYAAVYSEHTGWSAPVLVSDAANRGFTYPKVHIDNEGNAFVAWFVNGEIHQAEYRPEHG